jgi:tRNA nucleotidyltransferase/poly(A) polymerase
LGNFWDNPMTASIEDRINRITAWTAPGFEDLLDALLAQGRPLYVVGGNVRDFLLGEDDAINDLDLAMDAPVLEAARQAADAIGWAYYPLDAQRDVARLVQMEDGSERRVCDMAALRGALVDDLRTRDFTVNALAIVLAPGEAPRLLDVVGGVDDLRAGRLRPFAEENLDADPVRLLRAVRFAHKFDLTIDTALAQGIRRRAETLHSVSPERQRDELWKILGLTSPADALHTMHAFDLIAPVLPELTQTVGVTQTPPHHLDVFGHTLLAMDYAAALRDWLHELEDRLDPLLGEILARHGAALRRHFAEPLSSGRSRADWLVWHALCHDLGKPATRSEEIDADGNMRTRYFDHERVGAAMTVDRLTALRFSRREIQLAQSVVDAHMRPHHLHVSFEDEVIGRRAAFRFFRDTASGTNGEHTGVDVLLVALADYQATGTTRGPGWPAYLAHADQLLSFAFQQETQVGPPLLNGSRIMSAFDLQPGPIIGHVLGQVQEAQAAGEIATPEEALDLARRVLAQPYTPESDQ